MLLLTDTPLPSLAQHRGSNKVLTPKLRSYAIYCTRVYTKQLNPRADIGRDQQLW